MSLEPPHANAGEHGQAAALQLPRLLQAGEPAPVHVLRAQSPSPYFLTCDHGGRSIPARLGTLGLGAGDLVRHIAWDIGATAVAGHLSELLDATLVSQHYSRLVVDCNRRPGAHDFIAPTSESTPVPGNAELDEQARALRQREIFEPYHAAISDLLDARVQAGRVSLFVAVHSCTPVYFGVHRPWHVGVLAETGNEFAVLLLEQLCTGNDLVVGENQPYAPSAQRDYSVPVHAYTRGLANVAIEVRQDLISSPAGQRLWGERLAAALREAKRQLGI